MKLPFFQLDAFHEGPFTGNPAAVCILAGQVVGDDLMQAIAAENNLSETAFVSRAGGGWAIRWFTPAAEVSLCGHATLAAGAVVLERLSTEATSVSFDSPSGALGVERIPGGFALDFPAWQATPASSATAAAVASALGRRPKVVLDGNYAMAVYEDEAQVARLEPDFTAFDAVSADGVIATAAGESVDFVSRFFAPRLGVREDPVTGSAHCMLTPWWSERLGRNRLVARQISPRGGRLECETRGTRVRIGGAARFVIEGEFTA